MRNLDDEQHQERFRKWLEFSNYPCENQEIEARVQEDAPEQLPKVAPSKVVAKEPRGKAAPEYISRGTVLASKFRIEKMIGGGGFGQIYRTTDMEHGTMVATKVEPESDEAGRMVLEQRVLALLQGTRHSPRIYYTGSLDGFNFIVMQMLGRNLTELRKAQQTRRLTIHTTVRIGIQMTEALRTVHQLGYLHRDIKPSNMCVGIGEHRRIIYVVDFGMTRQFRYSDGLVRRQRDYAAFRGTVRYVSIAVHDREEHGPVDDLWSLYYTLIELVEGSLPWRNTTEHDEVQRQKRRMNHYQLCSFMPPSFSKMSTYLKMCTFRDTPNYDAIIKCLTDCCRVVDHDADFEWDDDRSTQSDGL